MPRAKSDRSSKSTDQTAPREPAAETGAMDAAKNEQTETNGGPSSKADDSNMLKGIAETTSEVVKRAASILEEEIAAGIVAARQVEERFINIGALRSGKPEEVMQRFRRDAHDVIDIVLDLVNAAAKSVGDLTQNVVAIRSTPAANISGQARGGGPMPTLSTPQPIAPGRSSEIPMALENESDAPATEFSFHCTDLVNPAGDRISAAQVIFAPSSLTIEPHAKATVTITINVPEGTPAGLYSGLLQAARLNQLRAVLLVQIA